MKKELQSAYENFHKLWCIARENPNYGKKIWQSLYFDLMKLINQSPFKL